MTLNNESQLSTEAKKGLQAFSRGLHGLLFRSGKLVLHYFSITVYEIVSFNLLVRQILEMLRACELYKVFDSRFLLI